MPSGAPTKTSVSGPPPRRNLTISFWPPIELAEPCSTIGGRGPAGELPVDRLVERIHDVPDAHLGRDARAHLVDVAVDRRVRVASMMPGVTCLPKPLTSIAPAGACRLRPTADDLSVHRDEVRALEDPGRALRPDRRAPHDDDLRREHRAFFARGQRADIGLRGPLGGSSPGGSARRAGRHSSSRGPRSAFRRSRSQRLSPSGRRAPPSQRRGLRSCRRRSCRGSPRGRSAAPAPSSPPPGRRLSTGLAPAPRGRGARSPRGRRVRTS